MRKLKLIALIVLCFLIPYIFIAYVKESIYPNEWDYTTKSIQLAVSSFLAIIVLLYKDDL